MSLITQCPACRTHFRAVQDQLRVSGGWVRCGRCHEVFDARLGLVPEGGGTAGAPSSAPAIAPAVFSEPDLPLEMPQPVPAAVAAPSAAVDVLDLGAVDAGTIPQAQSAAEAPGPADEAPKGVAGEDMPEVSFLQPPSGKPVGLFARLVLWLLALALLLGLAAQLAYQERDRIASMFPQAKPALQWACTQLGCALSGLRMIESVAIESSSLNRVRGDTYRLGLAVRNEAALELALPSIDFSLTDSQDQVVMRKVLSPAEVFPGLQSLAAKAEWSGQVTLQLRPPGGGERFTGYKVYAFYP